MASAAPLSLPTVNNNKDGDNIIPHDQQKLQQNQIPITPMTPGQQQLAPHPSAMPPQSHQQMQIQQQQHILQNTLNNSQNQNQSQNHHQIQTQSLQGLNNNTNNNNNYISMNTNRSNVIGGNNGANNGKPINYKNGKKVEPTLFNYSNYYNHREEVPEHYHPLVQYLENTELKYHNDNLHENSVIGFPTRSQLLREKIYHLPVLSDTAAEKSRYQRKLGEKNQALVRSRKKYDFSTYDQKSAHYFLTGARYNRSDTIDSKMLNKCGVFINKNKPDLVYIKSNERALNSFAKDVEDMNNFAISNDLSNRVLVDKTSQYPDFTQRTKEEA